MPSDSGSSRGTADPAGAPRASTAGAGAGPPSAPAAGPPAFRLDGVEVAYGPVCALAGLSLEVARGERVAVIGASGAGKSTLFGVLTRTRPVAAGRVEVEGEALRELGPERLRRLRRRIGTVHQAFGLVPHLSAGMNVALGEVGELSARAALRMFLRGPDPERAARAAVALARVGLADRVSQRVADLSGGQQQRVAVARLLLQRPRLILADEPVAAVDPVTGAQVLAALRETADEAGATLVASLHDVGLARGFRRVVALRAGAVAFDGPPEQLDDHALAEIYGRAPAPVRAPEAAAGPPVAPEHALPRNRDAHGLLAR